MFCIASNALVYLREADLRGYRSTARPSPPQNSPHPPFVLRHPSTPASRRSMQVADVVVVSTPRSLRCCRIWSWYDVSRLARHDVAGPGGGRDCRWRGGGSRTGTKRGYSRPQLGCSEEEILAEVTRGRPYAVRGMRGGDIRRNFVLCKDAFPEIVTPPPWQRELQYRRVVQVWVEISRREFSLSIKKLLHGTITSAFLDFGETSAGGTGGMFC